MKKKLRPRPDEGKTEIEGIGFFNTKEKWDEEFEDEIMNDSFDVLEVPLYILSEKYLGKEYFKKIRIKARKGKIVIERI